MKKHFLYTEIDLYWSPQLRTWFCSPSGTVPFLPCCHTRLDVPAHNRNLPGPLQCQEASLGFLLYSCSAAGFYQQWYPSLGFYLPHKFKVSFNSRCGACRHSYSGTEDNKSNKCSVLSPFYLDLALPAPLKPGAVGTLCWCLHCSWGRKKGGENKEKRYYPTPRNDLSVHSSTLNSSSSEAELWNTWAAQTRGFSSHTNEDFTTEQLLTPKKWKDKEWKEKLLHLKCYQ